MWIVWGASGDDYSYRHDNGHGNCYGHCDLNANTHGDADTNANANARGYTGRCNFPWKWKLEILEFNSDSGVTRLKKRLEDSKK